MLKTRIGLVYLPGALPCFEAFGNLPTDLVRGHGLVAGKPTSEALDMIIIPGGSLVESQTVKGNLAKEILKMADAGKFVLGICSGFQILSKGTDIGRLSATPIFREGLGVLDAEFTPLICTDQVKATIVDKSSLTDEVGKEVLGFHCHTYGNLILHKNAKPILVSHVKHLNYHGDVRDLVSGVTNSQGNVVGITLHALLDQNPLIIQGITKSLRINSDELRDIRGVNSKLMNQIKSEIGVSTNIHAKPKQTSKTKAPRFLLITALGSDSGKTFIVTGMASALKKRGFNVGILKVGGDIRDTVPALYMIKEPMRNYASIKVAETGWHPLFNVIEEAGKDYDFIIIEGAMGAFTGLLNENVTHPSSTAEVAAALGVPTVVVVACDNEGVEGAMVNSLNNIRLLKILGVKTEGIILNKVYISYLTNDNRHFIKQAFQNAGVELLGIVPHIELEGRGAIPEIEIKYEEFGAKALQTAESSMDLEKIADMAASSSVAEVDYDAFLDKFKEALISNYKSVTLESRRKEKCA